jgi:hypothetical protein
MLTYVLCKAGFQKTYIQHIRDETPPEWHIVETWQPVNATNLPSSALFVVSGSPTQQKERMLRIRFGGGAAAGAFTVPLQKFREFLEEFRKKV